MVCNRNCGMRDLMIMREKYWLEFEWNYHPSASEDSIKEVESKLGVKLPADYVQAMRLQNGGYLRYCIYRLPDPPSTRHVPPADPPCHDSPCYIDLNPYCSIEKLKLLRIQSEAGWDVAVEGLDLLVVFWQEGAHFGCFDYRESGPQGEPSIVFINADSVKEEILSSNFKISSEEVDPRTYMSV